ncbi:alpha-L-fucosidase [Dietzia cinnamea]|uniref:alpha-L-fucosidase n=1 Tax=Dietzia cinnamea TaxID=321318 RepID=UPI0035CCF2EB
MNAPDHRSRWPGASFIFRGGRPRRWCAGWGAWRSCRGSCCRGTVAELSFPASPRHDVTTPEHARLETSAETKWETVSGVGRWFAANRNEDPADIVTAGELVQMLVDVVSKNGNLLFGGAAAGRVGAAVGDGPAEHRLGSSA